jgi:hypothetical protein
MVLMAVVPRVCEDDVWLEITRETFERILDCCEVGREISIPEVVQLNGILRLRSEELSGSTPCLTRPVTRRTEHYPTELRLSSTSRQLEQRAPAADFYVIRVRAETQYPKCRRGRGCRQFEHGGLSVRQQTTIIDLPRR